MSKQTKKGEQAQSDLLKEVASKPLPPAEKKVADPEQKPEPEAETATKLPDVPDAIKGADPEQKPEPDADETDNDEEEEEEEEDEDVDFDAVKQKLREFKDEEKPPAPEKKSLPEVEDAATKKFLKLRKRYGPGFIVAKRTDTGVTQVFTAMTWGQLDQKEREKWTEIIEMPEEVTAMKR